jgi:TPP-dependent pyruvate/acetoin dehydrogenase alpha subunit
LGESVLCAVDYTDTKPAPGLMAELRALAEPTKVSILRFRDHSKLADPQLFRQDDVELFNLDPQNVFTTLLESIAASSDEEKEKLQRRYQEILQEIDAGSED